MIIDGEPCIVVDVKRSAPGKHGHAKYRITGMGLFDDKKRVILKSGGHNVEVPIIEKRTAQVLSYSGGKIQAMDLENYETFEITVPEEEREGLVLTSDNQINYWDVMNKKIFKGKR